MGFRFQTLNPVCKSFLSRLTSRETIHHHHHQHLRLLSVASIRQSYDYPSSVLLENPSSCVPRRWHFGHSHHHDHQHQHRHMSGEEGEKIFRLGLTADIGLSIGKAVAGYLSGSTALIADAAHSVSDVVLSGVALLSFKAANVPKDKEHPYGHGKFETLGALGISGMLLATGCGIAWHALELLFGILSAAPQVVHELHGNHSHGGHHHGLDMDHPILALSVTIASISVKEGLYWITKRAGERQGSGLMKANAWHHRADAISSVVALIGIGGSLLGVKFLDPLAGLVVSGMVFKAGLETGHQSVLELVDAAIPAQQLDPIRQTILRVEGVKGCHRLRGRRAGSFLYLDVHIVVDPFSTVSVAHGIGENVRHHIHKNHPGVSEVFIHIDPAFLQFPCGGTIENASIERKSDQYSSICKEVKGVEATVSEIFSSMFLEKMTIERVTPHLLQGKILLQIEVGMPPDMTVGEAMRAAEEAEEEILKAARNVASVSIQLRLKNSFPH
ncbi:PREDICTED: metal tolerance protein C1 [Tarenaya hassleriana]|uniref:metal tolerance protein C1 n=1 Tax=Tarenaya hassleriana TaxID=28532 RepID=UPI00053C808B|nr:PREDICTED: metal tolerance protein C1 [Tarenaya hassleriana]